MNFDDFDEEPMNPKDALNMVMNMGRAFQMDDVMNVMQERIKKAKRKLCVYLGLMFIGGTVFGFAIAKLVVL